MPGVKENGPAKLSLPLPVFIPLEQAAKQVRATATVVSELLVAMNGEGLQQKKAKNLFPMKMGMLMMKKETFIANNQQTGGQRWHSEELIYL